MRATFRQRAAIEAVCLKAGLSVGQYSEKKLKWDPLHPSEARLLSVNSRFSPLRADCFDRWHLVEPFLQPATNKNNTSAQQISSELRTSVLRVGRTVNVPELFFFLVCLFHFFFVFFVFSLFSSSSAGRNSDSQLCLLRCEASSSPD